MPSGSIQKTMTATLCSRLPAWKRRYLQLQEGRSHKQKKEMTPETRRIFLAQRDGGDSSAAASAAETVAAANAVARTVASAVAEDRERREVLLDERDETVALAEVDACALCKP